MAGLQDQVPTETSATPPSQGAAGARTSARHHAARKPGAQSAPEATGGEARSADEGFSQALEQQITQAIQPALDEFRQRMQRLSDQMAAMPRRSAGQADASPETPQGPETQTPTMPTQQAPTRQESAPQQREGEQGREPQPKSALIPVRNVQHAIERPLASALTSAVQKVGRSGAQWLQSLLAVGLGALLAESTHAAVQQRAEQGLHALLQKAFEAAPAEFSNQEMREKIERTLQLILREALDVVFAEGVRVSVQQGGQQTIQQALRGDFGGALKTVEEIPHVMMTALIAVLRRHQQTLIRLLLALVLLEVGSSLERSEKAE